PGAPLLPALSGLWAWGLAGPRRAEAAEQPTARLRAMACVPGVRSETCSAAGIPGETQRPASWRRRARPGPDLGRDHVGTTSDPPRESRGGSDGPYLFF